MSGEVERAKNEYIKIQNRIKNLKVEMLTKIQKKELDIMSYLSLITQRPKISKAENFAGRLKKLKSKALNTIRKEILSHIDYVKKVKTNMKEYLEKKSDFRTAIKYALRKEKILPLYKNLKKEWKIIRKYLNEVNLHDEDMVKYFVILESLFRILKYFHEKRDIDTYEKTKEIVKKLGEEWDIDEMVISDRLIRNIFEKFYNLKNDEIREIMLGKRSSTAKSQGSERESQGMIRKKLKIPKNLEVKKENLDSNDILVKNEDEDSKKSSREKEHPVAFHLSRMIKQKIEEGSGEKNQKKTKNTRIQKFKQRNKEKQFKLEEDPEASTFERIISNMAQEKINNSSGSRKGNIKKASDLDFVSKSKRQESTSDIFEALSLTYSKKMALKIAINLECQIFSSNFHNFISYENEVRRCGNTLEQLSTNRGLIDKIMVKGIDLEILKKLTLKPINQVELFQRDFGVQVSSKKLDEIIGEGGGFDKDGNEEKADFVEEEPLKNIKEDETKMLRELVYQLKKENSGLRATLNDIRSGLLAYSSPVKTVDSRGSEAR